MVALGGRMEAINCLRGGRQGGVKTDGLVGRAEVVVDRLWHSDHVDAVIVQSPGGAERVLAADGDQTVDAVLLERPYDLLHSVLAFVGVCARTAQDGPPARKDAAGRLER